MTYCRIEGCGHKRKSRSVVNSKIGASWLVFKICSCCAAELFPNGYYQDCVFIPPKIHYNCKMAIEQELKDLASKQLKNQGIRIELQNK